jgi:hypothetical protein
MPLNIVVSDNSGRSEGLPESHQTLRHQVAYHQADGSGEISDDSICVKCRRWPCQITGKIGSRKFVSIADTFFAQQAPPDTRLMASDYFNGTCQINNETCLILKCLTNTEAVFYLSSLITDPLCYSASTVRLPLDSQPRQVKWNMKSLQKFTIGSRKGKTDLSRHSRF